MPLPFVMADKKNGINWLVLIAQISLLVYLCFFREIQQWYFLTLFVYMPLYKSIVQKSNIFLFGLLLSYYPYIYLGGWDGDEKLWWKHVIIGVFATFNILYLLVPLVTEKFVSSRNRLV